VKNFGRIWITVQYRFMSVFLGVKIIKRKGIVKQILHLFDE